MKNSGILWIGEIPNHWKIQRLKTAYSLHGRIGWNGLRSDEFEEDSYAYLVTGQDFTRAEIDWKKCYQIRKERYDEDEYIQLQNGDMLITKDGTIGKIAMVVGLDKPACLNSGIFVMRGFSDIHVQRYIFWQLCSSLLKAYNDYINLGGTTIIHLYQNVFERMPLIVPPLPEQQAIADILDKKCSEIDEMVTLQERIIEELKAYKQSIITEAVTKGLNPNVPMKESMVAWIGKMPESWGLQRLKFLCTIQTGNQDTQDAVQDGQYPFYVRSPYPERSNKFTFEGEGILMAGDGAGAGRVFHHVFGKYAVHQRVYRLANISGINSYYFFYFLSSLFCREMDRGSAQSTVPSVRLPMLQNFIVCIPPLAEQRAIAEYIDIKCAEIDTLITLKQSKIESLKEYKKSIIYEYVTGKKEII